MSNQWLEIQKSNYYPVLGSEKFELKVGLLKSMINLEKKDFKKIQVDLGFLLQA